MRAYLAVSYLCGISLAHGFITACRTFVRIYEHDIGMGLGFSFDCSTVPVHMENEEPKSPNIPLKFGDI